MKKMAIITPPFIGHTRVLFDLVKNIKENKENIQLTIIVLGWKNVTLPLMEKQRLQGQGIQVIEIYDELLQTLSPLNFTFTRAIHLIHKIINACQHQDYLMYDFFAIEGYIASKYLDIPAICSVPAIMGPFNPEHALFVDAINNNSKHILALEKKYNVEFYDRIQLLGDGFFIPSDYQTVQWSWPALIKADQYHQHRQLINNTFMRLPQLSIPDDKLSQTIIYLSFGTVITHHLWDHLPTLRQFVKSIFNLLVNELGDHPDYHVIISSSKKSIETLEKTPANFYLFESVDQRKILRQADIFITHGGGNSINEAIDANVPTIVIPFFGDQHQSAKNVHRLGIGYSFSHEEQYQHQMIEANSGLYERKSLCRESLITAIHSILNADMANTITQMKSEDHITSMDHLLFYN